MSYNAGAIVRANDINSLFKAGTELVNFSNQEAFTQAVVFDQPFDSAPRVFPNIDTGAGVAARWQSRAINITATGFTLFVFSSEPNDPSSWGDVAVSWLATVI